MITSIVMPGISWRWLLLVAAQFLLCALPAQAATLNPATTAAVNAALLKTVPGDVVALPPGSYLGVQIPAKAFGNVILTSQDRLHPAVLVSPKRSGGVSGLSIEDVEISCPPAVDELGTTAYCIKVTSAADLHFRRVFFHGLIDGDPSRDVGGISLGNCSRCSIEDSRFEELKNGIGIGASSDVQVLRNDFRHIRADGVDLAASQRVTVAGNTFREFMHLGSVGTTVGADHSDGVQLFNAGQTVASTDIFVVDNRFVQGICASGVLCAPMQGAFLTGQGGPRSARITVAGNTITGGNPNAIAVSEADGVLIAGNTIAAIPGATVLFAPRLTNVTGVVETGTRMITAGTPTPSTIDETLALQAQIASLQSAISTADAGLVAANAQAVALQTERDAALSQATAAQATATTALGDLAEDRAALAAIRSAAEAALAANPAGL